MILSANELRDGIIVDRTPLVLLNQLARSPLRQIAAEAVSPVGAAPRRPRPLTRPRPPRGPRTRPAAPTSAAHPSLVNYDPARHHIAVTLSSKSKHRLLSGVPPKHDNPQGDHVTLVPPGQPLTDEHRKMLSNHIGKQVNFHATHHAADGDTQAVRVSGLDHLSDKPGHVTVSTGHGVPAVKSNDLLQKSRGERLPNWIPLSGTVHVVDRMAR